MVGRVIGKSGETIKALQSYSGALIQIDQTVEPTLITISGTAYSLSVAISMVTDIVKGTFKGFALLRQLTAPAPKVTPVAINGSKPIYAPGYGLIPPSQLYGTGEATDDGAPRTHMHGLQDAQIGTSGIGSEGLPPAWSSLPPYNMVMQGYPGMDGGGMPAHLAFMHQNSSQPVAMHPGGGYFPSSSLHPNVSAPFAYYPVGDVHPVRGAGLGMDKGPAHFVLPDASSPHIFPHGARAPAGMPASSHNQMLAGPGGSSHSKLLHMTNQMQALGTGQAQARAQQMMFSQQGQGSTDSASAMYAQHGLPLPSSDLLSSLPAAGEGGLVQVMDPRGHVYFINPQ